MDENPYRSPQRRDDVPVKSQNISALKSFLYLCWGVSNVLAIPILVWNIRMLSFDHYGEDLLLRPSFWCYQGIAWAGANLVFVYARSVEDGFAGSNKATLSIRVVLITFAVVFFAVVFFYSTYLAAMLST